MKRPAFQFYPADWRKDVELRSCSLAARGLWIDLLCIAHECEPYGHLMLNGRPMTVANITGQIGVPAAQVKKLLDELLANGVARQTTEGAIYSKRMVDDERLREARAEGGKAGAGHGAKGAAHGSKGGRPKTGKGGSETPLPTVDKPPPSSSSSPSGSDPDGSDGAALPSAVDNSEDGNPEPPPAPDPLPEPDKGALWRDAVALLKAEGVAETTCRTFMGELVGTHRLPIVRKAIDEALTLSPAPADARAWLVAACKRLAAPPPPSIGTVEAGKTKAMLDDYSAVESKPEVRRAAIDAMRVGVRAAA